MPAPITTKQMEQKKIKKVNCQYFDSTSQFRNWIENTERNCKETSSETGSEDFTLTESIEQANDLINGQRTWDDGVKKLNAIEGLEVESDATEQIVDMVHDVCGDYVDIGRYLDNEPECMIDFQMTSGDRVIDLYFTPTASAFVSTDAMVAYGVAFYYMVKHLQTNGYSVNVYAAITADVKTLDVCTVKIKDSTQEVEPSTFLYCCAHPSFFRRHWFAYLERNGQMSYGYGTPAAASKYTYEQLMWNYDTNPNGSYYFKGIQEMSEFGSNPDPNKILDELKHQFDETKKHRDAGKYPKRDMQFSYNV